MELGGGLCLTGPVEVRTGCPDRLRIDLQRRPRKGQALGARRWFFWSYVFARKTKPQKLKKNLCGQISVEKMKEKKTHLSFQDLELELHVLQVSFHVY